MNVVEILDGAKTRLIEGRWFQGSTDEVEGECTITALNASIMMLSPLPPDTWPLLYKARRTAVAYLWRAGGALGHRFGLDQESYDQIDAAWRAWLRSSGGASGSSGLARLKTGLVTIEIERWNDAPGREFADVMDLYDEAIRLAKEDGRQDYGDTLGTVWVNVPADDAEIQADEWERA